MTPRTRNTVQQDPLNHALVAAPLGREWVGFSEVMVTEVFAPRPPVRVPRTPSWVRGVVQREGRMVTLIDLAAFCGLPPVPVLDICVRVSVPDIEIAFGFERVAHLDALDGVPVPIVELPLHADWVEESLQIGPRTVHCIDLIPLVSALREEV